MSKTALLLIDIQNDYFPGGRKELSTPLEAGAKAKRILQHFRDNSIGPVVHIQHISDRPGATFFLPHTEGAEIHELVTPEADEKVIMKHKPNSFLNTDLKTFLDEYDVTQLVIVGMMSHMCVDATTRAASDLGYAVTLIGDACTTTDLTYDGVTVPASDVHAAFMASLQGLYANVMSADQYLKE